MTVAALTRARPLPVLDFNLVQRAMGYLAGLCAIAAIFSTDPFPFFVGGCVPWVLVRIVNTPAMPAAVLYLLLWQWTQIFVRVVQAWVDGDSLKTSIGGPNVINAYWYMLASIVVLAAAIRAVLGNLKPPTLAQRTAHFRWQMNDVVKMYIGATIVGMIANVIGNKIPSLFQAVDELSHAKIVALFTLLAYAMSSGRGAKVMMGVVLFEIGIGFTGFLSDFRGVFIFLAIAAVAARIKWKSTTSVAAVGGFTVLVVLALFWTSVKGDYRDYAVGGADSQAMTQSLSNRMSYLGNRAVSPAINLDETSYLLLSRLAYVDIFASVIDVQDLSGEPIPMRQWREAIEHVLKPRVFFPGKAPLSDSEVFMRLTRRFLADEISSGTSISVGYMGENFADLGFPGMLAGIAVLGVIIGGAIRLLMSFRLPPIVREGVVMALAFSIARDGVEVSLPKILGALFTFLIVFPVLNKFVFARVVAWLDRQGQLANMKRPR